MPNERERPGLPEAGSVWVDEGGNPYTVDYLAGTSIYLKRLGRSVRMGLGNFLEQMHPVEEMLEVAL